MTQFQYIQALKHANAAIQRQSTKIAELEKQLSNAQTMGDREQSIRDLEQTRKGFWLGFEDARCHPDEMNILAQWEGTKAFNQAKALKETK